MPDQIEVKDYIFKNNLHIILHILNLSEVHVVSIYHFCQITLWRCVCHWQLKKSLYNF